ncbi:hypothetical protein ACVGOW_12710 [Pseudonocardia saturnea]|nr:hypothetical protein [Pseudonocardia oceani]
MFTGALLAAESTASGGQLWRPLLIFGVIAVLMALVVVVQMTDPRRRRSRGEQDLDAESLAPDSLPPSQAPDPDPVVDSPGAGPERR